MKGKNGLEIGGKSIYADAGFRDVRREMGCSKSSYDTKYVSAHLTRPSGERWYYTIKFNIFIQDGTSRATAWYHAIDPLWPHATIGGISWLMNGFGDIESRIIMPRYYYPYMTQPDLLEDFNGDGYAQTIVHEWGHYALWLGDEYRKGDFLRSPIEDRNKIMPTLMGLGWRDYSRLSTPADYRNTREHETDTAQWAVNAESTWETVFRHYSDGVFFDLDGNGVRDDRSVLYNYVADRDGPRPMLIEDLTDVRIFDGQEP